MKTCTMIVALFLAATFFVACEKSPDEGKVDMSGISMENYPRVDGSTSTNPLNYIIAAKLLSLKYEWTSSSRINDVVFTNQNSLSQNFRGKFQCSQTHNAILNLINGKTDIIIVARKMSVDEKRYADSVGVALNEVPIALDALDFILNSKNSVGSLTVEQIQRIYMGKITSWSELGGANDSIKPFIRNANSGSQEMMNELVMSSAGMPDWEVSYADAEEMTLWSMFAVYQELRSYANAICFTPHYYKEYMINPLEVAGVKTLEINNIAPNENSIKNKTYPFVAPVYVMINNNLDKNSMAYKLYQWLQTADGKKVITESGYVPN